MEILIIIGTIILAIILIYLFLIAPRMFNRPDTSILRDVHYAHRGLFKNDSDSPENSLPAFKAAVDAGYGIELDVRLTKDNIPVVFHDATLDRMCNVTGKVSDFTYNELLQFRLAQSGEHIPTFAKALETIGARTPIIVEYKLDTSDPSVCALANEVLKSYAGPYCIESFHPAALRWYKKHRPDIIRGQLSQNFSKDKKYTGQKKYILLTHLLTNVYTRPDFIAYKYDHGNNLSKRLCHLLGAMCAAWTIRSPQQYDSAKKGFDIYIFDSFRL